MRKVTGDISMKALAAVPPHSLLPPFVLSSLTPGKNCRDESGAISPKNSKSDQTKQVNRCRGCGGESDGVRAGVAIIIFV
jgi:hypothetical protein